ncbi:hypothetical protein Tsubulata_000322 [Turnera subulata]|uniref:HMA domain-containing protein n=1 Tax=Turnera subulata TaxID=218843 RepID=A0A9Q0J002_9ROSI|nr:hypothetical protein Tsubulata_000322 [Turnera subulata]
MSKKLVLKVEIECEKCKKQLFQAACKVKGSDTITIDEAKGTLTVIGTADPVALVKKIRKKTGKKAEISTYEALPPPKSGGGDKKPEGKKEPSKPEEKKPEGKKEPSKPEEKKPEGKDGPSKPEEKKIQEKPMMYHQESYYPYYQHPYNYPQYPQPPQEQPYPYGYTPVHNEEHNLPCSIM